MKVTLLQHTPDPETAVALAARLCYSPTGIDELRDKLTRSDITAFLEKIMSLGHQSVLEHATFTFGIEGISRATSHQLVRHRLASYSQQSQRYVSHATRFAAVVPPSIAGRPELAARFEAQLQALHETYAALAEAGVPAEDARYILPNATETKIIVSMNARELRHFFALRCCERAQWEIRAMAVEMLKLVIKVAPVIFRDAGPGCLTGPCPEGALSCGRMAAVRETFKELSG
ncbi:flavin-dependent thymidylate synthase [Geotalea uraniireducens]|uniref:Flavin-dependent thymidylate synthase n=1 Tax=Geotalea uraniireducens TaxID=351604 RepID=A0ABM8EQK0_9BACT|nr:FAD-dependent thymidylate synthase [Geotalea uraniireducens]BDV44496.1 flavin-dependent thymidylate synthase [Geotalea uraniireducens]